MDSSNKPPRVVPIIQNIDSSVDLGCKLNLATITSRAKNAQYDSKRMDSVVMRLHKPKTTGLFFASGKILCSGAQTEEDSETAARMYTQTLQKIGFPVKFADFKIQNIVASCDIMFGVRLESLMADYAKYTVYEPEIYSGLIFKMKKLKMTVMVSASGKLVITGAKVKEDIYKAFEIIYPILQQYKKVPRNVKKSEYHRTFRNETKA